MVTKRALPASSPRVLHLRVGHLVFSSLLSSRKRRIATHIVDLVQKMTVSVAMLPHVCQWSTLAEPCEMESLAVKASPLKVQAHIGHCCVSVGLLAVLHLL